jgi:hypothetical protein
MNEQILRKNLKEALIESLQDVHRTLDGKYVPFDDAICYKDLLRRIADAEEQRNCCDRGTAARMHYNGLLAILRQKVKKHPLHVNVQVKLHLENKKSLNEATLFSTFVQPLSDVFETAKMSTLEALSAVWMTLRGLITFDPAKLDALKKAHEGRVEALENRYKDVLERTNASLTSPDAMVTSMLFAPNLFSTMLARDWSVEKIDSMVGIYKDFEKVSGSNKSFDKEKPGKQSSSGGSAGALATAAGLTREEIHKNYITMKSLFENDGSYKGSKIIKEEKKEKNTEAAVQELMKNKGFQEATNEMREAFKQSMVKFLTPLNQQLEQVNDLFDNKSEFGKKLSNAKSVKEIQELIDDVELNEESIYNIKDLKNKLIDALNQAEDGIQKLANPAGKEGQSFIELLKAQIYKKQSNIEKDKELSPEEMQKLKDIKVDQNTAQETAEENVLKDVKKGFFTDGKKQLQSIKEEVAKKLFEQFPFMKNENVIKAIEEKDKDFFLLLQKTLINLSE